MTTQTTAYRFIHRLSQVSIWPYLVLLVGVLIAATSAISVRFAQAEGVPSLVIATWRLIFAVSILTPIAWTKRATELRCLNWQDIGLGIGAGTFLAIHLATWIASLHFTSVASSTALVATNPLWVALTIWIVFGERLSRKTIVGLIAAFIGSLLVIFSDAQLVIVDPEHGVQLMWQNLLSPAGKEDTAWLGNGLALVGAVMASTYFLIGRKLRTRLSNLAYVWVAYSTSMVVLIILAILNGESFFSYSWVAFGWLCLLGIGPQLLGHTAFNWALAHLSTTFVTLAILGEPIGSAIFAYFIFKETFAPLQLMGFIVLLIGIGLGVAGEQKTERDDDNK